MTGVILDRFSVAEGVAIAVAARTAAMAKVFMMVVFGLLMIITVERLYVLQEATQVSSSKQGKANGVVGEGAGEVSSNF